MGVRHLESFLKKDVPNGTKTVSIKDECAKFQRKTGKKPTLVIDLMAVFKKISHDKVVELCGGQHNLYRKALEDILGKLSLHADLVFFEDGATRPEKLDECNRRRNERYAGSIKIMNKINEGWPLSFIVESFEGDLAWAPTYLNMVEEIAKKYGKLFVAVTKECDTELARYACENPSTLAVLADDSDFLIFKGDWRYFSFKSIDVNTLTTMEYNKPAVRKYLNLTEDQMKILSTLAGNDLIKFEELKNFHENVGCYRNKFPALAKFIREGLPKTHNALVATIAESILRGNARSNKKVWKDRIEDSLNQYKTAFDVEECSADSILNLCKKRYFDFCYNILNDLPENFALIYYDMRHEPEDSYVKCTLELFAKQVGILLQHNRDRSAKPGGNHVITCAKMSHQDYYRKFNIAPVYPEQKVPELIEFLNRQKYPKHEALRFSLLKWLVAEELLASHDLRAIPKNYLLDVLTLCFMVDKRLLTVTEADLILYTIKNVERGSIPDYYQPPKIVEPRAFKLSFLFSSVSRSMQKCFAVVGFKDTLLKIFNFDGVFFHLAYLKHINSGFNPIHELADLEHYRLYK